MSNKEIADDLEFRYLFAKTLRILRSSHSMTQPDLASKLNLTQAAVSQYENCARFPDAYIFFRTAKVFGLSMDELLAHMENRQP